MKVVIDVPDDFYWRMKYQNGMSVSEAEIVVNAFYNGTPLPKGHGDLIDRKDLMDRCVTYLESFGATMNLIKSAMTIIEADKEGAEE